MNDVRPLERAVEEWDRGKAAENVTKAEELRAAFLERFPLEEWPTMPLARYALGPGQESESYSWWLEYGTNPVGSIRGGAARKHLIWRAQDGWRFPDEYDSVEEAWREIRSGFVEAFELASEERYSEITSLASIPKASAVLCKSLYLYFPDRFVPIFSRDHINHFLALLGEEGSDWATVGANRRLTEAVARRPEFEGWSHQEVMYFLYNWAHPNPSRRIFKIAPGRLGEKWEECLANGYICVGWDEVGDLTQYEDREELQHALADARFPDNPGTATRKAKELWTLVELQPGDLVVANRGTSEVLAVGTVTEPGYSWDESRDEYRHTVSVDWDTSKARSIEPVKKWATTTVAPITATEFQRMFGGNASTPEPIPSVFAEIEEALERRGQVILYGPPGTGKTYTARRAAVWFLEGGSKGEYRPSEFEAKELALSAASNPRQQTWFVVANPSQWDWDKLRDEALVAYRYGRLKRNYPDLRAGDLVVGYEATPTKRVVALARVVGEFDPDGDPEEAFTLEYVSDVADGLTWDDLKDHPVLKDSEPIRFRCQGTLFRLSTAEAQALLAALAGQDPSISQHIAPRQKLLTRTTFHPSYTYEDFIEGYRPKETTSGGLELGLVDGLFKDVCAAAAANPDSRHVLIIDEINRGNIPKVFGELITLLEKDKRGLTVRLPQSGDEFFVPPNVYLIGTMNTADRSIHLLDTALRRRFGFVEMMPESDPIAGETVGALALDVFLDQLNAKVREIAGRERQIGHAVFFDNGEVVQSPDVFAAIFRHEILPLLQEYLYEDYTQLAGVLGETIIDVDLERPGSVLADGEALCAALASQFDAYAKA